MGDCEPLKGSSQRLLKEFYKKRFQKQQIQKNMLLLPLEKIALNGFEEGAVAQSVEQRTENPCVGGSIPSRTTKKQIDLFRFNLKPPISMGVF